MISWFGRRISDFPRFKPEFTPLTKVNFAQLTPSPLRYCGQLAAVTLEQCEQLATCVMTAPDLSAKEELSSAMAARGVKHQRIVAEIRKHNKNPAEIMAPFSRCVAEFHRATMARSWHEKLVTVYVTSGFLDEFFTDLAVGLPRDLSGRITALLEDDSGRGIIAKIVHESIVEDPRLSSHLALWGRRLVGDTLLLARSALRDGGMLVANDDERIEPVFTDLIGSHTRRMDELGLTA